MVRKLLDQVRSWHTSDASPGLSDDQLAAFHDDEHLEFALEAAIKVRERYQSEIESKTEIESLKKD